MNLPAIILLAAILCAECPACSVEERWLIAQTVVYRADVKSLPVDKIIYEPHQYQAVGDINIPAYRQLRPGEWGENLGIAWAAIRDGPLTEISHFASNEPEWTSRCEPKYRAERHLFYLCPDYKRERRVQ
jgi:hypothetical protein